MVTFFEYVEPIWTPELRDAVANAYRAFEEYGLLGLPVVCSCDSCVSDENRKLLKSTPLRKLPAGLLGEYNDSAHGWDHDIVERQFMHYLPRYLELIASCDPPDHIALDYALKNLGRADYRAGWPLAETEAVNGFIEAFLLASLKHRAVSHWPIGWALIFDIRDVLAMLINARADIPRILELWRTAPEADAVLHVAALRSGGIEWVDDWPRFTVATANHDREACDLIGTFAMDPDWPHRIEAAFFAEKDPRIAEVLSRGA